MKNSSLRRGIGALWLPALFVCQRPVPVTPAAVTPFAPDKNVQQVVRLAEAFKATLGSEQVAALQLPYSKEDAARWSNFPQAFTRTKRVGVQFGSLNATQLAAVRALLGAVLAKDVPNEGLDELEGTRAADDYFGTATGNTRVFNSGEFFIAFLGTPSTTGLWELQFGGHHYALANTYNGGRVTGVTPSFRGVEPATAFTQNGKTYQPVEQERKAFAGLLGGLNDDERTKARLSATYRDVLLGPGRDGQFPTAKQGLRVGELSAAQQKRVLDAISLYVNDLDPETAAPVLAKYTAGLADTYLAFSGSGTMNQVGDYVRLDGPGVWIEYSGQPSRDFPGTSHPHSVWRDRSNDYGGN
jgi:hypothetical protein